MKNRKKFLTILIACNIFLLTSCDRFIKDDENSPITIYDFSKLDQLLKDSLEIFDDNVCVLVMKDNKLIYKKSYGSINSETQVIVASASKWISAAVIMTLVDEGKLSLDDSVGKYLPIFTQTNKGKITIRQLFSHTSGLEGNEDREQPDYLTDPSITLEESVNQIGFKESLVYDPGTKFSYGSLSMQVGGRIAEIVSGKRWDDLFQEKIAKTCGMTQSYFANPPLRNYNGVPPNPRIDGGLVCSPQDYLNFLQMIVNKGEFEGKRILSAAAVNEMQKDQTVGMEYINSPYTSNLDYHPYNVATVRYGLGEWLDIINPETGSIEEVSSTGRLGTMPWIDNKRQISGVIFTQIRIGRLARNTEFKIRDIIRKEIDK